MSSLFGRFKSGSVPATPSLGTSPGRKVTSQTPLTPIEQLLADAGALRNDGSDKFFGMHNASNTCYCNSVVQCLYYSEQFREQVVNFPRTGQHGSVARHDPSIGRPQDFSAGEIESTTNPLSAQSQNGQANSKKQTIGSPGPSSPPPPQQENKESFDYQKKLALSAGPHLRVEQALADTYSMPESLFTSLKDLFEAIIAHESRTGIITPAKFLEVLRRNHETFRSNVHQDAHEFLNILLNEVVEQVEAYSKGLENKSQAQKPAGGLGLALPALASQANRAAQATGSWVHELFEGTLTSETRCLTCENISQRDEAFFDLSVDLEEHSSVTSCLSRFSEEEMLCERNKFHCDKCCGLQEAEKRMKIKRLPRILALHLKRFKFIEEIGNFRKLFHRVVYPFHLRLLNTTDDAQDPDRLYELYGVVVHLGSTPFHGHYVSIIKTRNRGWLLFDDELVLPVDKEYVRNFFGGDPRNPACAYVLFYQETTAEAVQREQEAEDAMPEVPAVEGFDSTGITASSMDGALSSIAATGISRTPAVPEEPESVVSLEHTKSAPPFAISAAQRPQAVENDVLPSLNATSDRPPSLDEPRSPEKDQSPSGVLGKGRSSFRFRNTSMSLRSKPKFGSLKEKDRADAVVEANGADGAQEMLKPQEKPQEKTSRFSFGKKKPTTPS